MKDVQDAYNSDDGGSEPQDNLRERLIPIYTMAQQLLATSPNIETAETAAQTLAEDWPMMTILGAFGAEKPTANFTLVNSITRNGINEISSVSPAIVVNIDRFGEGNFDTEQIMYALADDLLLADAVAVRFVERGLGEGLRALYLDALDQRDRYLQSQTPSILYHVENDEDRMKRHLHEIHSHLGTQVFIIDCGSSTIRQVAITMLDELTQPQLFPFSSGLEDAYTARIRRGKVLTLLRKFSSSNPDDEIWQEDVVARTLVDSSAVNAIFASMLRTESSQLSDVEVYMFTNDHPSQLYPSTLGADARRSQAAVNSLLALPEVKRQRLAAQALIEYLLRKSQ